MSYINDYEDNDNNKIPYDSIPINRNEYSGEGVYSFNRSKPSRFISFFMAILITMNLILCVISVYAIKHIKVKNINQYTIELGTSSEVASAYVTMAYLSSVGVAAGGICTDNSNFYTSTSSRGSGVVYRIDEINNIIYFATCYHVISGYENRVWVLLSTSLEPIAVSVVGYSSRYDLAILKYQAQDAEDLEDTLSSSIAISLYDSCYISSGSVEKVFAIGNSLASGISITEGIVSMTNVPVRVDGNSYDTRAIQTSAPINPGNSGGGLFNEYGEFVGLVFAKRHTVNSGTDKVPVEGTAYAIPSTLVAGIANKLISGQNKPTYIDFGISLKSDKKLGKTIEFVDYNGIFISSNATKKQIEKSIVEVEYVSAGSVSFGKLNNGDVINAVEFDYYDAKGSISHKKLDVFNENTIEDYAFSIVPNSTVKFYISNGEGTKVIDVVVTNIITVMD